MGEDTDVRVKKEDLISEKISFWQVLELFEISHWRWYRFIATFRLDEGIRKITMKELIESLAKNSKIPQKVRDRFFWFKDQDIIFHGENDEVYEDDPEYAGYVEIGTFLYSLWRGWMDKEAQKKKQ